MANEYDIIIIGGGINGCGIAADCAERGLNVYLCEQDDLASGTSSASSKLIHGGLRYLEYYEFRLVREALREREVLLNKAPHIIKPMRFIMPHSKALRPSWMISCGLFLYDHLAKRKTLEKSKKLKLAPLEDNPLLAKYKTAFSYADCWADDARLVILNAMSARDNHATIETRTRANRVTRHPDHWEVEVFNRNNNQKNSIKSKLLINAAGPWVRNVRDGIIKVPSEHRITLCQGSHIITPKFYSGDNAYILQHHDRRIIFVIPYLEKYCIIGTTDIAYSGDPGLVKITQDEITYLLDVIKHYFSHPPTMAEILHTYSGVRPLLSDGVDDLSAVTREYTLELNAEQAPLITIFGGKITTYRKLAESVVAKLKPFFPHLKNNSTRETILPGGDITNGDMTKFTETLAQEFTWLDDSICHRYAHTYGTKSYELLKNCNQLEKMGQHFGHGLYEREVLYLKHLEWAQTVDDILWRRTKLGLKFSADDINDLKVYLGQA